MLTKFTVTNFKSFMEPMTFDLGHPGSYEFNTEAVRDGVITKAMVYGFNGCGKSNLGLAMLDIVTHLTDKQVVDFRYPPYLNLNSENPADFQYQFRFNGIDVLYHYQKRNMNKLLMESLFIGGEEVIRYDFKTHSGFVRLKVEGKLNLNVETSDISRVKFVRSSAMLLPNEQNAVFQKFMQFVNNMLLFYSLTRNAYQGYRVGGEDPSQFIIEVNKVEEFEHFLHENNVNLHLAVRKMPTDSEKTLIVKFQKGIAPFWKITSTGTQALTVFYYWKLMMDGINAAPPQFVFMDEFDAFYHFELAESIVKLLTKSYPDTQVIFTTHNTDLLSNDILRPDCYFLLDNSTITPLCDLTDKDIRKAHNLQKMFKADAFQGGKANA